MYYKIYKDGEVLDVLTNPIYFKRLPNKKISTCERKKAEGVLSRTGEKKWFIGDWITQGPIQNACSIVEITQKEYSLLKQSLELKEGTKPETITTTQLLSTPTSKLIQEGKISLINKSCSEKIIDGVDVLLTDGRGYHFDLTIEDQINLLSLQFLMNEGVDSIPYHARGQEAKMFSREDVKRILDAINKHRLYQLTYANALKHYVQNLNDLDALSNVRYGMDIPEEYQTEALKSLLK